MSAYADAQFYGSPKKVIINGIERNGYEHKGKFYYIGPIIYGLHVIMLGGNK